MSFFMTRGEPTVKPQARLYVGLDPASRVDYAGIVVNEPEGAGREMRHAVRHIERTRGLSYPLLAEKLRILIERLNGSVTVAVDSTGLGGPMMDYLRDAGLKARLVPITFTAGHETRHEGGAYFVPKRELISNLGLLLETSRLRLSKTMKHASVLQRELESFTQTLSASGRDSYSAPTGQHDDLLSALALSVWLAQREGSKGGWLWGSARHGPDGSADEDEPLSRYEDLRRSY
jgi:hypothetical protein